jgi:transposase-like protein
MNKQYSKEEKKQLIAECQQWIEKGKSISSFAQEKGIPKGTLYCWVQVNKSNTNSPKRSLVHIPKITETQQMRTSPLLVEMRCGSLSFVFNEGYTQESIEATLLSLKKCGLL